MACLPLPRLGPPPPPRCTVPSLPAYVHQVRCHRAAAPSQVSVSRGMLACPMCPGATRHSNQRLGVGAVVTGLPSISRLSASSGALPETWIFAHQSVGPPVRQCLLGATGGADLLVPGLAQEKGPAVFATSSSIGVCIYVVYISRVRAYVYTCMQVYMSVCTCTLLLSLHLV